MKRLQAVLLLALALALPQAQAGMIATPASERERVSAMVERPEVARQLEAMGIAPDEAKSRVAAMSEAEVASLAGRLDSAIAGGALTNTDFLFIIVVILLVVVLL